MSAPSIGLSAPYRAKQHTRLRHHDPRLSDAQRLCIGEDWMVPTELASQRRALYNAALPGLDACLATRGVPLLSSGRRRLDHVLIDSLGLPALRRALDDVEQGAGGELRGDRPAFASTESSAALAVNSFAIFIGRSRDDTALGQRLVDPRFESRLRVDGVRAPVPPTLDVVFRHDDSALLIESKFLEPWRDEITTSISTQYDQAAAAISVGVAATVRGVRDGHVSYGILGAAQMLKHLLGIHSGMARRELPARCRLILAYWEPVNAGEHGHLFHRLRAEISDLAARVADQSVSISGLSYRELWRSWSGPSAPEWLQEHAGHLQDRYGVAVA